MNKPIFASIFFTALGGGIKTVFNVFRAGNSVFRNQLCKTLLFSFALLAVCLLGASVDAQTPVQLAPPLLKYQSVFFKNTAAAELKFAMQGSAIHYTLNNQTPTIKDPLYRHPIQINKSFVTLKAMVFAKGFLPSEIVSATFIKDGLAIKSVQQTPANVKYRGSGSNTLIDNAGGLTAINGNTWLGYQTDSVQVDMVLASGHQLSSILINCLQDQGSWIFLPQQIQVYCLNDATQLYELAAEKSNTANIEIKGSSCVPVLIPIQKKRVVQRIKIILKGIQSLPEWHAGKGQPGWLFIDEIKVY